MSFQSGIVSCVGTGSRLERHVLPRSTGMVQISRGDSRIDQVKLNFATSNFLSSRLPKSLRGYSRKWCKHVLNQLNILALTASEKAIPSEFDLIFLLRRQHSVSFSQVRLNGWRGDWSHVRFNQHSGMRSSRKDSQ